MTRKKKKSELKMPKFTENEMKRAVLKVTQDGFSVNRVAKEGGLCKKTLKSYVDKFRSSGAQNDVTFRPNYEINQVFTNDLEKMFEEFLIAVDKSQQKITRDFVRRAAYEFATNCNVHVPKTWNVRKQAGLDWMYGYLNRHPNIKSIIVRNKKGKSSIKDAEENVYEILSIEDIKIDNMNVSSDDESEAVADMLQSKDEVVITFRDDYFNSYLKSPDTHSVGLSVEDNTYLTGISVKTPMDEFQENLIAAYNAIAHDSTVGSARVYNLGEMVLVAENRLPTGSQKLSVTACCFISADGQSLAPFFVFPCKRFRKSMLDGMCEGVQGTAHPQGKLNDESFMMVLEHFQYLVKADPVNKRIVLMMDDDDHHVTINSIDFCERHGIEMVTLPPHYAQSLQPIGRYVFPMVKSYFNHYLDVLLTAQPHTPVSMFHMSALFSRIYETAFTCENIVNGFTDTGIYPLDEQILKDEQFLSILTNPIECIVNPDHKISVDFTNLPQDVRSSDDEESDLESEVQLETDATSDTEWRNGMIEVVEEFDDLKPSFVGRTPIQELRDNLQAAYDEMSEHGGLKPEKIYCWDEMEVQLKTDKSVPDDKERVTICCFANATGTWLPPFLVYSSNSFRSGMVNSSVKKMAGTCSRTGTIDENIFLLLLKYFQKNVKASPDNRVVLIKHCPEYHTCMQAIDFAEKNGIILVTVAPHVNEPYLPLEKTVFKTYVETFAAEWSQLMESRNKGHFKVEFETLVAKTFKKCFSAEEIVSGFENSGLWPLNEALFPTHAVCLESLKECVTESSGNDDENGDIKESESDQESLMSDDDVLDFYNKVETFIQNSQDEDSKSFHNHENQLEERILVLGETVLRASHVKVHVFLSANAMGTLLPPFVVYNSHSADVLEESLLGTVGFTSKGCIVTNNLFLQAIKHFGEHSKSYGNYQTLLLLEDKERRITEGVRQFAQLHGICLLAFPASDPKKFHPLENSFLKHLKELFEERHRTKKIRITSVNDVVAFMEKALDELLVPNEVAALFKEYGLCTTSKSAEWSRNSPPRQEMTVVRQKVKVDFDTQGAEPILISDLEDFIIEEEVELTLDEDADMIMTEEKTASKVAFMCSQCNKEFDTKMRLEIHESVFQCRYCDKVCCEAEKRNKHESTHMTGNNMHCCLDCDKQCATKAALVQHRRKHLQTTEWTRPKIKEPKFIR